MILQYFTALLWVAQNLLPMSVVMLSISVIMLTVNFFLMVQSVNQLRKKAENNFALTCYRNLNENAF